MHLANTPLKFDKILELDSVDGENKDGPIVRYIVNDEKFFSTRKGVYLIVQDNSIVYCGKFTNTFAKRWLYTKGKYVYHFKRGLIATALMANHQLIVFAQSEEQLREQLGLSDNEWISVSSIEEKIIRDLKPIWNSIGHK
ncbi:hypothetical protein I5L79_20715 [Hymenobacter sp. BT594]|uniref:GIY-YIG domain-containing protein n=1 Tax=Hymenobacter guriensis TaxID=2793065 RepID=A0ABS0L769_9BACT|nr:hypothetical protein [Hymenobacter guriensis]